MSGDQAVLKGDKWVYYLDGKVVSQRKYERRYPPPKREEGQAFMCASDGNWPVISRLSLACDPSQVAEMNERNRRAGIHAEYRADGACVIPDAADYKRLRRLEGFRDRDSYSE